MQHHQKKTNNTKNEVFNIEKDFFHHKLLTI